MTYEAIQVSKENGVATITLNRPPMNPLNTQIFKELTQAINGLQSDISVRAVIMTGSGDKAFAAGADVTEMANLTPVEVYNFCQDSQIAFKRIENLGKPVIAAINGLALGGGCELALCCDFRVAADTAKFGQPEIGLGIIPGAGGTQRLPRLIGAAKAKELIFLGDIIDASAALSFGLVNKVVPTESLLEEAQKLAKRLSSKPAVAMAMAKSAINTGLNLDISSALTLEIQCFVTAFASDDRKEGIGAFMEKRKPNFTGK
ncbi:enoyl-CoA hydratase/isomerase family protein [Desulfosporosinus shakirovi]|uniref:enoyl-CoA hydratase/isomerase family protein n=1 Tax=Desulfosporosinus shakirovi TaxID=2885154 RepID=UPI001E2DB2CD|nr:enoyl-CoA hydratase-related protein [Desulfosporosinus sp. SRJS8]MCB8816861.1 enoyl-CoA hydratase/isomerase family protein [Desulfosporosinus sp. SRJS8]